MFHTIIASVHDNRPKMEYKSNMIDRKLNIIVIINPSSYTTKWTVVLVPSDTVNNI